MVANWSRKLARPVQIRGSKIMLATLSDARAYIIALPKGKQSRNSWQRATRLLLAAADDAKQTSAATDAIENSLFLEAKWLPDQG